METLRKTHKEKKIKNTGTEIKNAFVRIIGRLDKAKGRNSELEDMSTKTS